MNKRFRLSANWTFQSADGKFSGPAKIPGTIHQDLMENGLIEDPFAGDNERHQMWIGETDWIYECVFDLDPQLSPQQGVDLVCEGLDTVAEVSLNGAPIGRADNMFRQWRFDATTALREQGNVLRITFKSALEAGRERQKERYLRCSDNEAFRLNGGQWLRKAQYNFGWDWGPQCVTCGIWKPLYLESRSDPRISHLVVQPSLQEQAGHLALEASLSSIPPHSSVRALLEWNGETVAFAEAAAKAQFRMELKVPDPRPWWPNGMGSPNLYELTLTLVANDGDILDTQQRRVGFRDIELLREPDKSGRSFTFQVNGRKVFAKGANWIPCDVFLPRVSADHYRLLLESAREANMNMVRVWGGGAYEGDIFYDLCDELGLMVWQDFMFACAAYPVHEPAWIENVMQEVKEQVRRLHHHPCIALWCGNNEIEQFTDLISDDGAEGSMLRQEYLDLFHERIPEALHAAAPGQLYWPSSGHSEDGSPANAGHTGDIHFWGVWWGLEPFHSFRDVRARFVSEFGFQSLPEMGTLEGVIPKDDRNLSSYTVDLHQRGNTKLGSGNGTMLAFMSTLFRIPSSFPHLLRVTQLVQGLAMQEAVEAWRAARPYCMGALYWQLNDCWPGASWSTIDHQGRWKASHYLVRQSFAPFFLRAEWLEEDRSLEASLIGDAEIPSPCELSMVATTISGEVLYEDFCLLETTSDGRGSCKFKLPPSLAAGNSRSTLFWIRATSDGRVLAEKMLTRVPYKHLELPDPGITHRMDPEAGSLSVIIEARNACALFVWLESPGSPVRWSDSFFHLRPGMPKRISVADTKSPMPAFSVHSLHDTGKSGSPAPANGEVTLL